jgi:hypothetical protein
LQVNTGKLIINQRCCGHQIGRSLRTSDAAHAMLIRF